MIFGSTAIKYHFPDLPRSPKDLDIIGTAKSTKEVEYFWTNAFFMLEPKDYCSPDELYTIKLAHLQWNINWVKHLKDFWFLQEKGCKVIPDFYDVLYREFEIIHNQNPRISKKVNLKQPIDKFFNSRVERVIPHDELHEYMKFTEEPMYKRISMSDGTASVDKDKFYNLSEEEKYLTILEELLVITYERYVHNKTLRRNTIKHYIREAYQDLVTKMTKGWFCREMIENSSRFISDDSIWEVVSTAKDKFQEIHLKLNY